MIDGRIGMLVARMVCLQANRWTDRYVGCTNGMSAGK